jgi:TP901 family phage tail tape measure protein
MARNVSHTITFTFSGVDALTPVANKVTASLKNVEKAFANMASSSIKQGPALNALFAQMQTMGAQIAASLQPIAAAVTGGNNQMAGSINNVSNAAKAGKGSLKELAGAYNALIVVKQAARLLAGAVKPAMELEKAQTDLKVSTGLTAENIGILTKAAMQAAEYTVFTPPEAIEAAKRLNLAVRDTKATAEAMLPVLMLAQTYLSKDVTKAADLAATTMGAFRLRANELEPTLNKLVAGSLAVGVQVEDLREGMGKLGVAAGLVGTNFDDIYPAYLMAIKGGLGASEAATGLKTAMARLTDPKHIAQLEAGLGLTLAQGGAFSSVRDIMVGLADASVKHGKNWTFMANQIRLAFGDRAVKPIMANIQGMVKGVLDQSGAVRYGADAYDYIMSQIANNSELLQQMNEEAMKPLSMQIERLSESINNLLVTAFQPLASALSPIVGGIASGINAFRSWMDSGSALAQVFKVLLAFMVNIGVGALTILTPFLALGAAGRIAGTAMAFLTKEGSMAGAIFMGMTTKLMAYARTAAMAVGPTNWLGKSLLFASSSAKNLWRSLLGPVGLILTLVEFLPDAIEGVKFLAGEYGYKATKEVASAKVDLAQSSRIYAQSLRRGEQSVGVLQDVVASYASVIRDAAAVEKAKLPVAPERIFGQLTPHMEALRKTGRFTEAGMKVLEERISKVNLVRERYAAGMDVSKKEMADAQQAMNFVTLAFKGAFPHEKDFVKGLDQVNASFTGGLKESKAMSTVFTLMGYRQEESEKRMRQAQVNANEEMAAARRKNMAAQEKVSDITGIGFMQMTKQAEKAGMSVMAFTQWMANIGAMPVAKRVALQAQIAEAGKSVKERTRSAYITAPMGLGPAAAAAEKKVAMEQETAALRKMLGIPAKELTDQSVRALAEMSKSVPFLSPEGARNLAGAGKSITEAQGAMAYELPALSGTIKKWAEWLDIGAGRKAPTAETMLAAIGPVPPPTKGGEGPQGTLQTIATNTAATNELLKNQKININVNNQIGEESISTQAQEYLLRQWGAGRSVAAGGGGG